MKRADDTLQRILIDVEQWTLRRLLAIFAIIIIGFAAIYFLLDIHEPGTKLAPSFLTSLYFSVVTISSLGYGDVLPRGLARLFAALEVLSGLAIMGLVVAKLSSVGLSHHVRRLYETDIRVRLATLRGDFGLLLDRLGEVTSVATNTFSEVPLTDEASVEDRSRKVNDVLREVSELLRKFRSSALSAKEYITLEAQHGAFFNSEASSAISETAEIIDNFITRFTLFLNGISLAGRMQILGLTSNKRPLLDGISDVELICETVLRICDDQLKPVFVSLKSSCTRFPQEMFNVPSVKPNQPDQAETSSNEPQAADTPN
jgi:hypothetical protein